MVTPVGFCRAVQSVRQILPYAAVQARTLHHSNHTYQCRAYTKIHPAERMPLGSGP